MHHFSIVRFIRSVLPAFAVSTICSASFAQPSPLNGPRPIDPGWHALVGATVIPAPGESIENATVVLRDGVIVSVSADADPPAGARVWDVAGLMIYPGLIDAHVPVEAPRPDADLEGAHWNPVVMPQRSALDGAGLGESDRESLRCKFCSCRSRRSLRAHVDLYS